MSGMAQKHIHMKKVRKVISMKMEFDITKMVEGIAMQAKETQEEFIIETIHPYCEDILQIKINKEELKQILLNGIQKQQPYEDCRSCKKWDKCPCGKEGHENGTSIGYSIGECKEYESSEDCISRENAEMELVIKMDKEVFTGLINNDMEEYAIDDLFTIANSIRNGTPLPEHHGRLIDADAFQKYCFDKNFDKRLSEEGLAIINMFLEFQPTVIEGSEEA